LSNLQLLTDHENLEKNAKPFDAWISTRDPDFRARHVIPDLDSYEMDRFEAFIVEREGLIYQRLRAIAEQV
jgi:hypothetical protein